MEVEPRENASSAPPPRRSDRTRSVILDVARRHFAAHGFERTTIRAVAADAGIDPALVIRYYGSKARLFDAALDIALRLPDLSGVPADHLAEALVRHFLVRWEHESADDTLLLLLRSAVTNDRAAERMREIFATQVAPGLGGPHAEKVGLIVTQLLGLALSRHLLRIPAVARLTPGEILALYVPAVGGVFQLPRGREAR
ncbi:TetR/AcrR family transcriptional regulator [Streptomyces heilongjiangensis]|uniref:TetR/AcrR family transcriptional regulator n=1 Tax=Streptomyces heilongjiangensis TaxID=945052 RepID=A0ABW1B3P9_9ACTN|nr:TetR family transcriptional regulator [Streptomyces heilongjiangensis]MDC2945926.1 TetR family transcriptional regulator [Streptomyces heilongjiangensis]